MSLQENTARHPPQAVQTKVGGSAMSPSHILHDVQGAWLARRIADTRRMTEREIARFPANVWTDVGLVDQEIHQDI